MVQQDELDEFIQEPEKSETISPAALFHMRSRRRGFVDPTKSLYRTHRFNVTDSGFDVGDYFPTRTSPITVSVTVRRDAAAARGIILEMGDSTTGLAIWIPDGGTDISACAGDAGDDGVTLTAADVLAADDEEAHVVFAVIPGSGEARLWVNGRMMAAGAAVNGELPNGWGADEDAGIGDVETTCSDRVPVGDQIALANASIISPVSMFVNQRPRQFTASLYQIAP